MASARRGWAAGGIFRPDRSDSCQLSSLCPSGWRRPLGCLSLSPLFGLPQPGAVHDLKMFHQAVQPAVSFDELITNPPDFIDNGIFNHLIFSE